MTKTQESFLTYLKKLEEYDKAQGNTDNKFVMTALASFYKYCKQYENEGITDAMNLAMKSTESFVGYPCQVHLN